MFESIFFNVLSFKLIYFSTMKSILHVKSFQVHIILFLSLQVIAVESSVLYQKLLQKVSWTIFGSFSTLTDY